MKRVSKIIIAIVVIILIYIFGLWMYENGRIVCGTPFYINDQQTGECKIYVGCQLPPEMVENSTCREVLTGRHICTVEEKLAEICTLEYSPVCGSDNVTYGNGCGACSSKVDSWTRGEC